MDIAHLALALGASLTAGLNLYLTILTLGLLNYYRLLDLPPDMQILSHPWVLVTALALFLIEFVADKIPYLDNTWDAIHGFIRVPAGAVLAAAALSDLPAHLVWVAALMGGFVSFSAHGAKASARLAANTSPEPFSNWILSFLEDFLSLGVLWLVTDYPYVAFLISVFLLSVFLAVIYVFYRFFKRVLFGWRQSKPAT
jgi:hypothetical protein